jgi:hypothetical protein
VRVYVVALDACACCEVGEPCGDGEYVSVVVPLSIDGFRHVQRFRKSGPVQPGDRVADLEPGVFDGAGEAVEGAGAAEGEYVPAGFEDAQAFGGPQTAPVLELMARPGRINIPPPFHDPAAQRRHVAVVGGAVPPIPARA